MAVPEEQGSHADNGTAKHQSEKNINSLPTESQGNAEMKESAQVSLTPDPQHLQTREGEANLPNTNGQSHLLSHVEDNTKNEEDEDGVGAEQDKGIIVAASDMNDDLAPKKKKKKRSKKPASQRGLGKPTGFEENYADAPLTPEQFAEIREIFHKDISFTERILRAIQRFERTRKLSPERRDIFYKYLAYGGVDVGPNMFQGQQDVKNMDKDEIATALAQTNISEKMTAEIYDSKASVQNTTEVPQSTPEDPQSERATQVAPDENNPIAHLGPSKTLRSDHKHKYVVDFVGTMKAFLSRRAHNMFGFETEDRVALVTTTLERFMDYLLQHDVCPEYEVEVLKTRNLCRTARTELWHCAEVGRYLPGDFNIACSTVFGGQYEQGYDGKTDWGESTAGEHVFVGLTPEKATQIIGFAMAAAASHDLYTRYAKVMATGGRFNVARSISGHGFEITEIELPTSDCLELYRTNVDDIRPVGKVVGKFWQNPDALPEDLTVEEQADPMALQSPYEGETFEFFLEESTILRYLKTGQKIECTIHQLECGICFFDNFMRIFPTFEMWIHNEMTYGYKEPKPLKGSLEYIEDEDDSAHGSGDDEAGC